VRYQVSPALQGSRSSVIAGAARHPGTTARPFSRLPAPSPPSRIAVAALPASTLAAGATDAMGPGVSTRVLAPQAGRPPTSKASNARGHDTDGAGRRRHDRRFFFQAPAKRAALLHSPTRGRQRTRSDPNGLTDLYPFSAKMSRRTSSTCCPRSAWRSWARAAKIYIWYRSARTDHSPRLLTSRACHRRREAARPARRWPGILARCGAGATARATRSDVG